MGERKIELVSVDLPDFGYPKVQPEVGTAEYDGRIATAGARARAAGLDFLMVYGDREHFANIAYLTGHDPRFEEALLVIPSDGERASLILGNEGMGHATLCDADVEHRLYQPFGLMGQDWAESPRIEPVLKDCGVTQGCKVGVAGWKYVGQQESDDPEHWFEVPAFLVDALRTLTGDSALVTNATAMFMNPSDGLRLINSVDQLAAFEFGALYASQSVRNLIEGLEVGLTELQAVERMHLNGLPLSAHANFSTGPRARIALPSPDNRVIRRGSPFFVGLGLRGGLTARAGFVIADESELPHEISDYLDRLVKPYYATVVAWYEAIGLDVTGGEIQSVVDEALAGSGIRMALNPGHLIHLEEWLVAPIYPGSTIPFQSGMLVQCDMIPVCEPQYHTTNAEDTIALADEDLRNQLAMEYPGIWARIQARRAFMVDVLGIHLKPEVLPFSNTAAMLQPFGLSPDRVLAAVD